MYYDEQGTKQETAFGRLVAAHSIIGVFARKRGVCEGIAKATKLLFNAVDMDALLFQEKRVRQYNNIHIRAAEIIKQELIYV